DFWINHDLGMALQECRPPRYEDAIRFLTAAAALRPDSAGVRVNLGAALAETGRLDEAAAAYRQAIRPRPAFAAAHPNLGLVLWRQWEFGPALAAWKQGHELAPGRTEWGSQSARRVEECRRLAELEGRLPAVLRGEVRPADATEYATYAQLCSDQKLYAAS